MPAKQAKEAADDTPPPALAANPTVYRGTTPGYDFYLQSIVEIQKSVGGIESTIKHLYDRSQANEIKLDATATQINDLAKEMHGAKKVVWIIGSVCGLLGTVGLIVQIKSSTSSLLTPIPGSRHISLSYPCGSKTDPLPGKQ